MYMKCAECPEKQEDKLLVLPCIHVVCEPCLRSAMYRASEATTLPVRLQPTKYHHPSRFECPVCSWPQYVPFDEDGNVAYPNKLPLHVHLVSAKDWPCKVVPSDDFYEENKVAKTDRGHDNSQGNYIYESNIGSFGNHPQLGQMRRVTGMAVDEYRPHQPLVVLSESKSNLILSFHLSGKLEQARKTKVRIRDVCIAEKGTVVATVAEENYALAKWDSALTLSGVRHENLFRDNYGHGAQINSEPFGIARDSRGRFMVTTLAKDRVCRWDEWKSGDHIDWFGNTGRSSTDLLGPYYVTKLSNDMTVVSSTNDHKVKIVYDETDTLVTVIGGLGCDHLDLCFPHGVCVDVDDNIYIADTGNFRVVVYNKDGDFLSCAVTDTWNYGTDVKPTNVAVMRDGRLLVVMQGREYCKVHVYLPRTHVPDSAEDICCQGNWTKCWSRRSGCSLHDYNSLD
ncbi:hypothetical protein ACOMHN_048019 [Nucella lapillus]